MSSNKFSVGQRVYVASLHRAHSSFKKEWFLHRVVVVLSFNKYRDSYRYHIAKVTSKRTTMFINEKHLEELDNQEIRSEELFQLKAKTVQDIQRFDESVVTQYSNPQVLAQAYKQAKQDQLIGKMYSTIQNEILMALFEKAGISEIDEQRE